MMRNIKRVALIAAMLATGVSGAIGLAAAVFALLAILPMAGLYLLFGWDLSGFGRIVMGAGAIGFPFSIGLLIAVLLSEVLDKEMKR